MDAAPSAPGAAAAPPQESPPTMPAWPRSAQAATVFLLGVAATLLAVHGCRSLRWGSRPTELERGALPLYRIDLNRADLVQLLQVPGVGPSLAGRIDAYRRQHGPFESVSDLRSVHGIGPTTLERLQPWLGVQEEGTASPAESYGLISPTVPLQGRSSAGSEGNPGSRKAAGKKEAQLAQPVNLNQATAIELQRLPGIGPKRARLIINERAQRPFTSIDDLRRVPGIGPKTLDKLRPYITVESAPMPFATTGRS